MCIRDSIVGPDDKKCELVTPILHYEDIELLQEPVSYTHLDVYKRQML